ncbi:hypothetical protein KAS14_01790 [Candidatus Bathyarchaeota archaeon]|nr:hypothetical protein [Candidatus Bathyarchaeota archaeon]
MKQKDDINHSNSSTSLFKDTFKLDKHDYWSIKGLRVCPRSQSMKLFPLIKKIRNCLEYPVPCDHPDKYNTCTLYLAWRARLSKLESPN